MYGVLNSIHAEEPDCHEK